MNIPNSANGVTNASVTDFLKTLFGDLHGSFVELRSIGGPLGVKSEYLTAPEEIKDSTLYLDALEYQSDLYFGVCPRHELSGKKTAVREVKSLWVDLDPGAQGASKTELLSRLESFPIPPSIVVDSGRGLHAYWLLKSAFVITDALSIRQIENILCGIAEGLNADKSASELARILRIPGSWNTKNPTNPVEVTILEFRPGLSYDIASFEQFVPKLYSTPHSSGVPERITGLLENMSDGNRNVSLASVVGWLHRAGMKPDGISALLRPHSERCGFPEREFSTLVEGICNRYPAGTRLDSISFSHIYMEETETNSYKPVRLCELIESVSGACVWDVEPFLPEGAVMIVAAPPGYGKSWMLLELAIAIAQGHPWLGKFDTQKGVVLYIDEESIPNRFGERMSKLLRHKGAVPDSLEIHVLIGQSVSLSDPSSVLRLSACIRELHPRLVIIDSLIRVHRADENSATDMAKVFQILKDLTREHNCSLVIADHQRKPGPTKVDSEFLLRGSTEKAAFVDTLLSLKRQHGSLVVEQSKARHTERHEPFVVAIEDTSPDSVNVHFVGDAGPIIESGRLAEVSETLMATLKSGELFRDEIHTKLSANGHSTKIIDQALKKLAGEGLLSTAREKREGKRGGPGLKYWLTNSTVLASENDEQEGVLL